MKRITTLISLMALGAASGCGSDAANSSAKTSGGSAGSAGLTTRIDNPYWPMAPGTRWVFRERDGGSTLRVGVTVTRRTKVVVSGIRARVVHDIVTEKGRVVENTYDWYAQDRAGTVWYLGEDTKAYEPGKPVSTKGSWEDGVDGARRGIAMPAHPRVGQSYRQEYYRGQAEDRGRVLSLDKRATVPFGSFSHLLQTRDYTRLEPSATEHKYYARGVGPILAVAVHGGGREQLVKFERGS
jgi:hypothetical protein